MAQVVNGRPRTAESRFQSQTNLGRIYGGNLALRGEFQKIYSLILPALIFHSSIHQLPRYIIPVTDSTFKQHKKMIKVMLNESRYFSNHYTEIFDILHVRLGIPCLWHVGYWVGFRFLMCLWALF
jgi:hypothetical protein